MSDGAQSPGELDTPAAAAGVSPHGLEELIRAAMEAGQAETWTSLPVRVKKKSQDGHTVDLECLLKVPRRESDGTTAHDTLPDFLTVPITFSGGGGVTLTHALNEGDEGFIEVASRAQGSWHQNGGVQNPEDTRMHSLSDVRFRPGARSDPRKLKGVSKDSTQQRTDDKQTVSDVGERGVTNVRKDAAHQVGDDAVQAQKGNSRHVIDASTIQQRTPKFLHNSGLA